MKLSDAIAALPDQVWETMQQRGLSYRQVAQEAGVPHVNIHQLIHGSHQPRLTTLVAVARWLEQGEQ